MLGNNKKDEKEKEKDEKIITTNPPIEDNGDGEDNIEETEVQVEQEVDIDWELKETIRREDEILNSKGASGFLKNKIKREREERNNK